MRHETPLTGLRAKKESDPSAFTDAIRAAALVAMYKGGGEAARQGKKLGVADRVVEGFEKANVAAGSVQGIGISSFGPTISAAFMQAVRNTGVADEIAASSLRFDQAYSRFYLYSQISAATVAEGAAKVLSRTNATATDLSPVKVANLIGMTQETIQALGDNGLRSLGAELKRGVAAAADTAFLAALSGNSTDSSISVADWGGFLDQFEELLRQVDVTSASKLFLVVSPEIGKGLAVAALKNGIDSVGWNSGSLANVELRVSESQTANRISLIDATGLATYLSELSLRSSSQASVEMVDSSSQTSATTVGAVQQVSAFQTGTIFLLAERSISVKAVRTNAFAHMTGVTIGDDGGSPAGA
jgi:hypothetical protein